MASKQRVRIQDLSPVNWMNNPTSKSNHSAGSCWKEPRALCCLVLRRMLVAGSMGVTGSALERR